MASRKASHSPTRSCDRRARQQFPDYGERQRGVVHQRLERMDRELSGHQFVAGDRFTIADITALVAIDIGGRLADIKMAPELSNLTRWHNAVSRSAKCQGVIFFQWPLSPVCLHHRTSRLVATTERVIATNAAKVSTALTACEYSHCRRAASKSAGVTVQLLLATFIGYVNIQKIPCVAARQRNAASERKRPYDRCVP